MLIRFYDSFKKFRKFIFTKKYFNQRKSSCHMLSYFKPFKKRTRCKRTTDFYNFIIFQKKFLVFL
jgi:hypothetical protein